MKQVPAADECERILSFIERETDTVVAHVESFGTPVTAEGRCLLISLCLINETQSTARELRERVGINLN